MQPPSLVDAIMLSIFAAAMGAISANGGCAAPGPAPVADLYDCRLLGTYEEHDRSVSPNVNTSTDLDVHALLRPHQPSLSVAGEAVPLEDSIVDTEYVWIVPSAQGSGTYVSDSSVELDPTNLYLTLLVDEHTTDELGTSRLVLAGFCEPVD